MELLKLDDTQAGSNLQQTMEKMNATATNNDIVITRPSVDGEGFTEPKELDPLLYLLIADRNI